MQILEHLQNPKPKQLPLCEKEFYFRDAPATSDDPPRYTERNRPLIHDFPGIQAIATPEAWQRQSQSFKVQLDPVTQLSALLRDLHLKQVVPSREEVPVALCVPDYGGAAMDAEFERWQCPDVLERMDVLLGLLQQTTPATAS